MINALAESYRIVLSRPVRSLLTALGVCVSVSSIMLVAILGISVRVMLDERLEAIGKLLIVVRPQGMDQMTRAECKTLNADYTINQLTTGAAEAQSSLTEISYGPRRYTTTIDAATPSAFTIRRWQLSGGRFYRQADDSTAVVVLGSTPAQSLFPAGTAVGKTVRIMGSSFKVIGVLKPRGRDPLGRDHDDVAFIPLTTSFALFNRRDINVIILAAKDTESVTAATQRIEKLLPHTSVNSVQDMAELGVTMTYVLNLLTVALAGISLLVGGVGVMVTLLASVTERMWEIGLKTSVGATPAAIALETVAEAIWIVLAGGLAGLLLGGVLAWLLCGYLEWPTVVPLSLILLSLLLLFAVSLLVSVYPAWRGLSVPPIEALRCG